MTTNEKLKPTKRIKKPKKIGETNC